MKKENSQYLHIILGGLAVLLLFLLINANGSTEKFEENNINTESNNKNIMWVDGSGN